MSGGKSGRNMLDVQSSFASAKGIMYSVTELGIILITLHRDS